MSSRPLEHLSDDTLQLLVERADQLKEGGSVMIDRDGQVVAD